MEVQPMNLEFNQCPNCGSKRRFFEEGSHRAIVAGNALPDWRLFLNSMQGAFVDNRIEKRLTIGTKVEGYNIRTDVCMDCGTIYAVRIVTLEATKQLVPQPILPANSPLPRQQRPGMRLPPGHNNPFTS